MIGGSDNGKVDDINVTDTDNIGFEKVKLAKF